MADRRDEAEAQLDELLCAWRREVVERPVPPLIDLDHAVDIVLAAKQRGRVHPPPDGARTRPGDLGPRDAQEG